MRTTKKGISLIILVITIVVISILATTAIVSITGDNIINFANSSISENKLNNIREAAQIAYDKLLIQHMGDTTQITEEIIKQKVIEGGIQENDLEGMSFSLGENIKVGYKQNIGASTTISNNIPGLLSFKIYGNSVQNGTPTPNAEVPIESVGERTKNLFDISKVLTRNQLVINNGDGKLLVTASSSSSGASGYLSNTLKDYAPDLEVGKTYVLNATTTGTANRIYLSISKKIWTFGQSRTITQEDLDSTVIWYANGNTDTTFTAEISNIQIEEGTVASFYEPYGYKIPITVTNSNGTTTHNIYLNEPLRKIGEYADYIDFENGKVIRKIKEVELNGSESWALQSINPYGIANFLTSKLGEFKDKLNFLSNRFTRQNTLIADTKTEGMYYANYTAFYFRVKSSTTSTVAEFNEWLSENNVILDYVPSTPTEEKVNIPEIITTRGDTTVKINTEIVPSGVELFYQYN